MSGISIEVNGLRIATIDLAAMKIVDVSARGTLYSEPKAELSAMGGDDAAGGCGHLIWISEHALLPGDVVNVRFNDVVGDADRGKTIEECYPDEAPSTRTDFTISDDMAAQLRARPRLHEAFLVHAATSSGQQAKAASDDHNTAFTFGLLWDSLRPSQARVRLSTNCLDDVLARSGGTDHLRTTISLGESVSFLLIA